MKLTVQFVAAMAHDGIELENVPLGLGKILLCFKIGGELSKTLQSIFNHGTQKLTSGKFSEISHLLK